jgi:hypothetical protein
MRVDSAWAASSAAAPHGVVPGQAEGRSCGPVVGGEVPVREATLEERAVAVAVMAEL